MQTTEKNTRKYECLLAAVISVRASSFIFNKMILTDMSPFTVLSMRFLTAFFLLLLLFSKEVRKMTRKTVFSGIVIGVLFFITMALEMLALEKAESSLVSLLENCAIIFVPIFEIFLFKKLPDKMTVISTVVAMTGVLMLAVLQGNLQGGFLLGLLSGVSYGVAIIVTQRLTKKADGVLGIGMIQVGTMGVLSLGAMLLLEEPVLPKTGSQWLMIGMLAVVCTGFGFTLQPVAQSRVSAQRASVFCALSPAISALLGVVVLHEKLGLLGWIGLLLILSSILLPYIHLFQRKKAKQLAS